MAEQAAFDVKHYDLSLTVDPKRKHIAGTASVEVLATDKLSWLILDLDPRFKVSQVRIADEKRWFQHRGTKLWINLNGDISKGNRIVASIDYQGHPRQAIRAPWDGGFTWSKTTNGHPWIATTVQGEGADLWWPCKDHPSDKPESFTLRIRVPKNLVVAANGRLIEEINHIDGTKTYHWHTAFPISNYNVALNIAPYDTLTTNYTSVAGDIIPVTYWILPENKSKGAKLLPEIIDHLHFYERILGPYPFRAEKYGVAETPHLGMEHQSIIAYGNNYRGGPHGYDWLHHHELGHEWWGNLVTAQDWRHFWIHEGTCTYMQALYAEEREGIMAYHHFMYDKRKLVKSQHPIVPSTSTGMADMFKKLGNDPYYKGAWMLHTLRYLVGKEQTLNILRRFCYPTSESEKINNGSAVRFVNSQEFIRNVEKVTGHKLDWMFNLYLNQPKLPKLISEIKGDKLLLRWEVPRGFEFPMPLEVEVDGKIERVEMISGQTTLDANRYRNAVVDPNSWILKETRLISAAK